MLHENIWLCSECEYKIYKKEEEETDHPDFADCENCNNSTNWNKLIFHQNQWLCYTCVYENDSVLDKYTEEEETQLSNYAEENQPYCHYCDKTVKNPVFDEKEHQYCNKRCLEMCEDYRYACHLEEKYRVLSILQYHQYREEKRKREDEIIKYNMVLLTIDAFKELQPYGKFY
jgi:hypothetical protein